MNDEIKEIWLPIKGYEDKYLVSNLGNVKTVADKLLIQWINWAGYPMVKLSGPRRDFRVHRLVAEAFVSNPENKPYVNHIDNNRANPNYLNLEWCTQKENLKHADNQGRLQKDYWVGKRSPNASLSDNDVLEIRSLYATNEWSWQRLGNKFNLSKRAIGRIINMETYSDVQ